MNALRRLQTMARNTANQQKVLVGNRHNGKRYPATYQHWPHGIHFQIHSIDPETWGRDPSGVGTGQVMDQGWQRDLETRGWVFPDIPAPVDVRSQEMKRLAGKLVPPPPTQEAKPPRRGSDYKRDPSHDPHLPHTTHYREHPDLQIPPEAQAVIDKQWPEVIRTFQQWDNESGMLMLYRCVRDACDAAGWDKSMAYQMRDHLITLLNNSKVRTLKGGTFQQAKFKPEPYGEALDQLLPRP